MGVTVQSVCNYVPDLYSPSTLPWWGGGIPIIITVPECSFGVVHRDIRLLYVHILWASSCLLHYHPSLSLCRAG